MIIKDWKKDLFTIPNWLSFFRLVLIPVYVSIYLKAEDMVDYAIAAGILAVSCLTDMIDGKIARHFNMTSTIGKVAALFVLKEGFQLVAGILAFRHGKMLSGALITGKICTCVLFVSLIVLVLMPDLRPAIINGITIVDGGFMLVSFVHYALVYFKKSPKIQDLPSDDATT